MTSNEKGFTLVELAVVMIVIGLLIGGVLVSINLVEQARVNAVISNVNGTDAAINTFYDKYRAKPGDSLRARSQIPGCDASNFCVNGDGNQFVASDGTDNHTAASNIVYSAFGSESIQFWKHLALSDIMSGIDPSANPADLAWGKTHPSSPFGGGFEFYYDALMRISGNGAGSGASHVMRMSADSLSPGRAYGVINNVIAAQIDTKMDDGDPNAGVVIADYGSLNNECKTTDTDGGHYNSNDPSGLCILYFRPFSR